MSERTRPRRARETEATAVPSLTRWPGPRSAYVFAALSVVLVVAVAVRAARSPTVGEDFAPLYFAALAMRLHEPLYQVPNFVYPPLAALVARPLTFLDLAQAFTAWMAMVATATAVTAALLARILMPGRSASARWGWASVILVAGACTRPWQRSLALGNISLFWPLVVVVVCLLWARARWHAGTALLVASLAVKPLLAPLLLIPALRRRTAVLATWCGAAVVASLLTLNASTGAAGATSAVASLLHASHFTGKEAPLNISLAGLARVHGWSALQLDAARVGVLAVGVAAFVPAAGLAAGPAAPFARARELLVVATAGLAALFLANSISEVHYVPILLPGALVALTSGRRPAALAASAALLAYAAAIPTGRDHITQDLLVATQVLTLVACWLTCRHQVDSGGNPQTLKRNSTTSPSAMT